MSEKPAVSLNAVSFRFPDAAKHAFAFKDISFSLGAGEFACVVGPSGAGKSTLLRVVAGVIAPSKGVVERNFKKPAMVFQGHGLFPWLSALNNTAFGLRMEGVPEEKRIHVAREKLREVGLAGFENRFPHQLSGGQRQRVAIARALAIEPDLLLMDEPFASLDTLTATALKKDVLALWGRYKMAILMVSHLIGDAVELSDRIVVFKKDGTVHEIVPVSLPRPRDTRSAEFFKAVDMLTDVLSKEFSTPKG